MKRLKNFILHFLRGLSRKVQASIPNLRWSLTPRFILQRKVDTFYAKSPKGWLFILGINNSGTTLLSRVLSYHPEVTSLPGGGQAFTSVLPNPNYLGVSRMWTRKMESFRWVEETTGIDVTRIKWDWMPYYQPQKGYLLEKSPPNTVRSKWLQAQFKPTKFIAIVRSPYAVCEGIRRRKNVSISEAALHWTQANSILLEDMRELESCLMIKYEDLTSNPVRVLRQISSFLELATDFDVSLISDVSAHSVEGRTKGISNLNELSLKNLSKADIAEINSIAGNVMDKLGYSTGRNEV